MIVRFSYTEVVGDFDRSCLVEGGGKSLIGVIIVGFWFILLMRWMILDKLRNFFGVSFFIC